jgi:hypothetical protein
MSQIYADVRRLFFDFFDEKIRHRQTPPIKPIKNHPQNLRKSATSAVKKVFKKIPANLRKSADRKTCG